MNAKEANKTPIKQYLASKGIYPVKDYRTYSMYHSPFREDRTPSFKVSHSINLWVDFGDNSGGTLLDLVIRMEPTLDVASAIKEIEYIKPQIFSLHQQEPGHEDIYEKPKIQITDVKSIKYNLPLCQYLKDRGVDYNIAGNYVKAVSYRYKAWSFSALGNRNEKGWTLRSAKFKGCTAQAYSFYSNCKPSLSIFEGIFDFLSYLMLSDYQQLDSDYLILNSLSNLNSAIPIVKKFRFVRLYFDNDISGKKSALRVLAMQSDHTTIEDMSNVYANCKDLNEYLTKIKNL